MADEAVSRLRHLCGGSRDGALLRVTLANALLAEGDSLAAIAEVRRALAFDPDYSAAWKLLGKTLEASADMAAAADAYRAGIAAASKRGDKQAQNEMQVFLRRVEKRQRDAGSN